MKTTTRLFAALSILMLFFMTSCASTKVTGEWKDPQHDGQTIQEDYGNGCCQAAERS